MIVDFYVVSFLLVNRQVFIYGSGTGFLALDNRTPASIGHSNNDSKAAPTSAWAMSGVMFCARNPI
jgi:hypothetical protein